MRTFHRLFDSVKLYLAWREISSNTCFTQASTPSSNIHDFGQSFIFLFKASYKHVYQVMLRHLLVISCGLVFNLASSSPRRGPIEKFEFSNPHVDLSSSARPPITDMTTKLRVSTPEILWHGGGNENGKPDPVYAVDFHPAGILVTAGIDANLPPKGCARVSLYM
jgi:hypothetical protein